MTKITFMIAGRNTLPYHKLTYESVRKNLSPEHEVILLSDGSTDGTAEWFKQVANEPHTKVFHFEEHTGIPYVYNKGVEMASNEWVCLLHSDMYVPKGFDTGLESWMNNLDFITTLRVEPPVYPTSADKITKDFGIYHNTFDAAGFDKFAAEQAINRVGQTQKGMFFPWCIRKSLYQSIGGCDTLFAKYLVEDDDYYLRVKQAGARYAQVMDVMVYHFCSRSSKYSGDKITNNGGNEWQDQYMKSAMNFIRKWGVPATTVYDAEHDMHMPTHHDIGYVIPNASMDLIRLVEPFATTVYTDLDVSEYIKREQTRTQYNMAARFKKLDAAKTNKFIVEIGDEPVSATELIKIAKALNKAVAGRKYKMGNMKVTAN